MAGRWYGWASAFTFQDVSSDEARDGLLYARFAHEERLSLAELARRNFVSDSLVSRRIQQAKRELFGRDDLADRTIYYRLATMRRLGRRRCQHPVCRRPLSVGAHGNQRYCEVHGRAVWRTWRSRHDKLAA
jgi:hypothetical protein